MIRPALNVSDYHRCESAKIHAKGIRNGAPNKFQPQAVSLCVYILANLNQVMDFIRVNFGEVKPIPLTALFDYSDATIRNLQKSRDNLRAMYAMLPNGKRSERKNSYTYVNELLKDLIEFVQYMRRSI